MAYQKGINCVSCWVNLVCYAILENINLNPVNLPLSLCSKPHFDPNMQVVNWIRVKKAPFCLAQNKHTLKISSVLIRLLNPICLGILNFEAKTMPQII